MKNKIILGMLLVLSGVVCASDSEQTPSSSPVAGRSCPKAPRKRRESIRVNLETLNQSRAAFKNTRCKLGINTYRIIRQRLKSSRYSPYSSF